MPASSRETVPASTSRTTWLTSNNPVHLANMVLLEPYFGGEEQTKSRACAGGCGAGGEHPMVRPMVEAFSPEGVEWNHPAAHVMGDAGSEPELQEAFPLAMVVVEGLDPLHDWDQRYAGMLRQKGKVVRVVEFPELADDIRKLVEEISSPAPSSALKWRGARHGGWHPGHSHHFKISPPFQFGNYKIMPPVSYS
uniref:Alpha/beta hydrolase fold-3 domain-containing protein n=1 Tax=Oryza punctata TaxID=4537 RepID=A0A0E0JJ23_ORYPU